MSLGATHTRPGSIIQQNGIVKDMGNMRIGSGADGLERPTPPPPSYTPSHVFTTHPLNLSKPLTVPIPPGPPAIELRLRGCRIVERFVLRTVRRSVSQNLRSGGKFKNIVIAVCIGKPEKIRFPTTDPDIIKIFLQCPSFISF